MIITNMETPQERHPNIDEKVTLNTIELTDPSQVSEISKNKTSSDEHKIELGEEIASSDKGAIPTHSIANRTRVLSKSACLKVVFCMLCFSILFSDFSTNLSHIKELGNIKDTYQAMIDAFSLQKEMDVHNVLQYGNAKCFVHNITKTLSLFCSETIVKTFSLGEKFNFDDCTFKGD